jgi:carbon-monoxide dehydrogenase medium subunit
MKAFDYAAPRTIHEAVALLAERGDRARVLAGGTDIIVQVREGRRDLDLMVDIKGIREANQLEYDPEHGLRLGSAVPCCRIAENGQVAAIYPALHEAASLVGGVQIQSRASVGGNLCNASPAADTIPPLIVYGAQCVIAGPGGQREVPAENFCTGPGRTVLGRGEFLVGLRIPPPKLQSGGHYLRFIPRNEMDIAVVGVGAAVTLDRNRSRCLDARIALAAVAPTPLLVAEAGAALVDGSISETLIDRAASLARAAARPISDMRGDADYRRHLVGVLTKRALERAIARAKES